MSNQRIVADVPAHFPGARRLTGVPPNGIDIYAAEVTLGELVAWLTAAPYRHLTLVRPYLSVHEREGVQVCVSDGTPKLYGSTAPMATADLAGLAAREAAVEGKTPTRPLELTQTNLQPGNCWQTAVACILRVDADNLPDQVAVEASGGSYTNALQGYLHTHHGLAYAIVYAPITDAIAALKGPGYHVMTGPSVRTVLNGSEPRINHAVVGRSGAMVWDPHPSRAGLLRVESWGLLVPPPVEWRAMYDRLPCLCPTCIAESEAASP